jgi:murein DD-endopeptidase MepM/ murein hydrolase activator NlpD
MNSRHALLSVATLLSFFGLIPTILPALAQSEQCQAGTTSIIRHTVANGETLASIAQNYNLKPATLTNLNPGLGSGVRVGQEILVPPADGILVQIPRGKTWREVAAAYKVRPDVLFELNGCQKSPNVIFVPLGNKVSYRPQTSIATPTKLSGYPLLAVAPISLAYGWQIHPTTNQVFFHSGWDLLANVGTQVSAVDAGTVVLAQEQGSYGQLVIINHRNGLLQTRYAHLGSILVQNGQTVKAGDVVGTVGTTGKPTSPQPHLLFEVRSSSPQGWVAQDPVQYLK